jgi:hypothetical protein
MLIVIALLIATAATAEDRCGMPDRLERHPDERLLRARANNKCRMMPTLGAPCLPGWSAYSTTASRTTARGGEGGRQRARSGRYLTKG